jgi:hypothetical protein
MSLEEEYQKHVKPILAAGFSLDPPGYERLNMWTHVLYQNHFASVEMATLIGMQIKLFDKANFHETFARFYSAIVTYGRCFASAGKGIVSLDAKSVFAKRPDLKPVHDRMIEIRNKVVAHTEGHELVRVTIGVKEETDRIVVKHLITPAMPMNELESFHATIDYVGSQIIVQINKYLDYLGRKMGKPIIPDELG